VLVALFFMSLATAIFFGYYRLNLDTSLTEESEREAAFKILDDADAMMLSEAWDEYSTTALGPPNKPAFFYVQKKRQELELGLGISAGIALVTGLAAGAVAAGRRQ
jgi:hypothetical protein